VPTLAARRVLRPDGSLDGGIVDVEGDTIVAVRAAGGDLPDRTLAPGFVDLQVNGIDDVDVATARGSEWDRLDGLLAAQGVTTWCPTLVTSPLPQMREGVERVAAAAARTGTRPAIAGAHLEGPFIGGAPGAHPREHIVPIDKAWLDALPPAVAVVTLAPEIDGAQEAIGALLARGMLPALGHSSASYEEAEAGIAAGARLVTHCFNGMPPLHHRKPGIVGAALADPRVAVSLIADLVHVHPAALALAMRAKGRGRVALVTDAVAWRADRHGGLAVHFDGGAARLADGTLAGSAVGMDQAVRNIVGAGIDLASALIAASTTPADLLGLADRGRLAAGCRADLVALGPQLELQEVWIGGVPAR
jgi:N-acetylglucosamine-6-phosphate deacetylase